MNKNHQEDKKTVAQYVLDHLIERNNISIGIGSGTTVDIFIDLLAKHQARHHIQNIVVASDNSHQRLLKHGFDLLSLNDTKKDLDLYIDSADEVDQYFRMIKGGGGASTREKIVANCAEKFICMINRNKLTKTIGDLGIPIPIEVLPVARSYVARKLVELGANPVLRIGYTTDNGNLMLDAYGFELINPMLIEEKINNITGVVENGIFAKKIADIIAVAEEGRVELIINH